MEGKGLKEPAFEPIWRHPLAGTPHGWSRGTDHRHMESRIRLYVYQPGNWRRPSQEHRHHTSLVYPWGMDWRLTGQARLRDQHWPIPCQCPDPWPMPMRSFRRESSLERAIAGWRKMKGKTCYKAVKIPINWWHSKRVKFFFW